VGGHTVLVLGGGSMSAEPVTTMRDHWALRLGSAPPTVRVGSGRRECSKDRSSSGRDRSSGSSVAKDDDADDDDEDADNVDDNDDDEATTRAPLWRWERLPMAWAGEPMDGLTASAAGVSIAAQEGAQADAADEAGPEDGLRLDPAVWDTDR
jgi:hypothetical protein